MDVDLREEKINFKSDKWKPSLSPRQIFNIKHFTKPLMTMKMTERKTLKK